MLEKIKPAVKATKEPKEADQRTSKNATFVDSVAQKNVNLNIDRILHESDVLAEMQQKGEIMIIGAMYDVSTGVVTFYH